MEWEPKFQMILMQWGWIWPIGRGILQRRRGRMLCCKQFQPNCINLSMALILLQGKCKSASPFSVSTTDISLSDRLPKRQLRIIQPRVSPLYQCRTLQMTSLTISFSFPFICKRNAIGSIFTLYYQSIQKLFSFSIFSYRTFVELPPMLSKALKSINIIYRF